MRCFVEMGLTMGFSHKLSSVAYRESVYLGSGTEASKHLC